MLLKQSDLDELQELQARIHKNSKSFAVRNLAQEHAAAQTRCCCCSRDYVLPAHSRFITWWNVLILLFTLQNILVIPFRVAFGFTSSKLGIMFTIDFVGDVCFIVDLFLQFRSAYYKRGVPVTSPKRIARRYLRSWFALDLFAALPFDLIQLRYNRLISTTRLPKMIRIFRVIQLIRGIEEHSGIDVRFSKLLKLPIAVFFISHTFACFSFVFGRVQGFGNDEWLPPASLENESHLNQYLQSLYWAFALMSGRGETGLPSTNPQYWFTFLVMAVGIIVFAYGT
jgi:potassium voltage-gated channel Eag-related subfamily H protein 8